MQQFKSILAYLKVKKEEEQGDKWNSKNFLKREIDLIIINLKIWEDIIMNSTLIHKFDPLIQHEE